MNKKIKPYVRFTSQIIINKTTTAKKQKYKRKYKYKNKNKKIQINTPINKSFFIIILLMTIYISFKSTLKRRAFDEYKPHKVFIEAHRGVNHEAFQNTKEAILLAIKYGLDSFETDTWLSKDNVLVLVHGGYMGDISRYYNRNYKVINTNWKELSILKTKRGNLSMPRLDEIMELTKNKIFMNLEIKDFRYDLVFPQVVKLIEKYDYFSQISISSFHHGYYKKINEYNNNTLGKKISFGFIYGGASNPRHYPYNLKYNSLNILWTKVSKDVCKKAHAKGMAVLAWFYMGINETKKIYQRLFDSGVDIICSNDPLNAKKFRYFYYKKKFFEKKNNTV